VAAEELQLSFRALFRPPGKAVNAASILPGLLSGFGDVPRVLAEIAPRKLLVAAGLDEEPQGTPIAGSVRGRFTSEGRLFTSLLES